MSGSEVRRLSSPPRHLRKVFGDFAADDACRIAAAGAMELHLEITQIIIGVFEPGDVYHFELQGRCAGWLLLLQVGGHGFFEVLF